MRLEQLRFRNFRGFVDREFKLHPSFNLIIGDNGTGKTSVLEGAAVAIGSWLLGFRGADTRHIRRPDIRRITEFVERRYRVLPQYPVTVTATGTFESITGKKNRDGTIAVTETGPPKAISWERSITGENGRTNKVRAREIKKLASEFASSVLEQHALVLPLIRYFGAGRLWQPVRDVTTVAPPNLRNVPMMAEIEESEESVGDLLSPFYGYKLSVDKRCNPDDLMNWMAHERRIEIDEGETSSVLRVVYAAVESMLPEAKSVRYSIRMETLIVNFTDGRYLRFTDLSDGFRNVISIAADLAIKAAMLNPQLADGCLSSTPGVVLIDELDLHLHPTWQRRVIEDLRRTFPRLQFICTTHSPFLVQTLRSGEELHVLDGAATATLGNYGVEAIAADVMGVENPEASPRYFHMLEAAKAYLVELNEAQTTPRERLEEYKRQLAERIAPFSENAAFQALLEVERIAKIGE